MASEAFWQKSTVGAAVHFFRYKQEPGQTIEGYAQQVNFLAIQCQYNNDVPLYRFIRDVFISGLQSAAILSAVLQTTDTQKFEETVQRAKTAQQLKSDAYSTWSFSSSSLHWGFSRIGIIMLVILWTVYVPIPFLHRMFALSVVQKGSISTTNVSLSASSSTSVIKRDT